MDWTLFKDLFKDVLLVIGTLSGSWLSQRSEDKRAARRDAVEQDRTAQENMRWVASGHLKDITDGLKKLGKQMFELAQAVYDLRGTYKSGLMMGIYAPDAERQLRLEKASATYNQSDSLYREALNEAYSRNPRSFLPGNHPDLYPRYDPRPQRRSQRLPSPQSPSPLNDNFTIGWLI